MIQGTTRMKWLFHSFKTYKHITLYINMLQTSFQKLLFCIAKQ